MAALKGNNLLVKRGNDDGPPETFTTLAGARTKNVSINNNPIDVTTDDDIQSGTTFRSYITGVNELNISVDGIATNKAAFDSLMDDARDGGENNYEVEIVGYGTIAGPFRIGSFEPAASYDDTVTFSLSLVASGAWTYTAV